MVVMFRRLFAGIALFVLLSPSVAEPCSPPPIGINGRFPADEVVLPRNGQFLLDVGGSPDIDVQVQQSDGPQPVPAIEIGENFFSTYYTVDLSQISETGDLMIEALAFDRLFSTRVLLSDGVDTTPPSAPVVSAETYEAGPDSCFADPSWILQMDMQASTDDFGVLYYKLVDEQGTTQSVTPNYDGNPVSFFFRAGLDPRAQCYRVIAVDVAGLQTASSPACVTFGRPALQEGGSLSSSEGQGCTCVGSRTVVTSSLLWLGLVSLFVSRRRRSTNGMQPSSTADAV